MKTLYVSDLDGTLLRSNETTSEYTNSVINNLTDRGMIFSYATARSLITAKKVTNGLRAEIPLIVYNGAFIVDNLTGEVLVANYFDESVGSVLDDLFGNQIFPIVYARIDGRGDVRTNAVQSVENLKVGNIFYITCIDSPEKLNPMYDKYKETFHCVYQKDIYTDEQWLEIMPLEASKANPIKQLQKILECDRVITFGDGRNDIDMFELADESYAVQNADEQLKRYATSVISSNDEDGVAHWLEDNYIVK